MTATHHYADAARGEVFDHQNTTSRTPEPVPAMSTTPPPTLDPMAAMMRPHAEDTLDEEPGSLADLIAVALAVVGAIFVGFGLTGPDQGSGLGTLTLVGLLLVLVAAGTVTAGTGERRTALGLMLASAAIIVTALVVIL